MGEQGLWRVCRHPNMRNPSSEDTGVSQITEAVTWRDEPGMVCWRIRPEVIDGILARDFNRWLRPDGDLLTKAQPKGTFTERLKGLHWKNDFTDIFPENATSAQNDLNPEQIRQS